MKSNNLIPTRKRKILCIVSFVTPKESFFNPTTIYEHKSTLRKSDKSGTVIFLLGLIVVRFKSDLEIQAIISHSSSCPIKRNVTCVSALGAFSVFPNPVEDELTVTADEAYEIAYPNPHDNSQAPPDVTEKYPSG